MQEKNQNEQERKIRIAMSTDIKNDDFLILDDSLTEGGIIIVVSEEDFNFISNTGSFPDKILEAIKKRSNGLEDNHS